MDILVVTNRIHMYIWKDTFTEGKLDGDFVTMDIEEWKPILLPSYLMEDLSSSDINLIGVKEGIDFYRVVEYCNGDGANPDAYFVVSTSASSLGYANTSGLANGKRENICGVIYTNVLLE